jgi:CRP/FNR family transcriptional regulator/voltage-gated potassium channel
MEIIDLLQKAPLFAEVSKADLEELVQSSRLETYKPGRVIIREGRVGAAFFLIVSGAVEVIKGIETPEEATVATLGAGEFFGEIANMKHSPRSASVRAVEETQWKFPIVLAKIELALAARTNDKN